MPDKVFKATINDMPRQSKQEGQTATAIQTNTALYVWNWLEPGIGHDPHEHPEDQLLVVFQGKLDVTIDGEVHHLAAGELVYIPSNVPHGGLAVGDETVVELTVYGPAIEESTYLAAHQLEDSAPVSAG
jgi:quercetin dioxygenase-like cupin family protein